jgi:hypothetical protein
MAMRLVAEEPSCEVSMVERIGEVDGAGVPVDTAMRLVAEEPSS